MLIESNVTRQPSSFSSIVLSLLELSQHCLNSLVIKGGRNACRRYSHQRVRFWTGGQIRVETVHCRHCRQERFKIGCGLGDTCRYRVRMCHAGAWWIRTASGGSRGHHRRGARAPDLTYCSRTLQPRPFSNIVVGERYPIRVFSPGSQRQRDIAHVLQRTEAVILENSREEPFQKALANFDGESEFHLVQLGCRIRRK